MITKVCPRCSKRKPLDGFHRNERRKDSRTTYCKECRNAASRKHPFVCKGCKKEKLGTVQNQQWCLSCQRQHRRRAAAERIKTGKKICAKCRREQSMEEFHNSPWSLDGKNCWCKRCTSINSHRRYVATHDFKPRWMLAR